MDVDPRDSHIAELERLAYAQGAAIRQLHERLNVAHEAILVMEARMILVTSALDRWADRWEDLVA
jgi:hypothetical protein